MTPSTMRGRASPRADRARSEPRRPAAQRVVVGRELGGQRVEHVGHSARKRCPRPLSPTDPARPTRGASPPVTPLAPQGPAPPGPPRARRRRTDARGRSVTRSDQPPATSGEQVRATARRSSQRGTRAVAPQGRRESAVRTHDASRRSSNMYPTPRTVTISSGSESSRSIRRRSRRMWTSTVRGST